MFIYTIIDPKSLSTGDLVIHERRPWVSGVTELERAHRAGRPLRAILGNAAHGGDLLAIGEITAIEIGSAGTTIRLRNVRRVPPGHQHTELVLRTGRPLRPTDQRPYRIIRDWPAMPDFG